MLPLPKRPHVFHSILIGCMHKEIFQFFSLFFKSVLPFSVRNFSQLQFSLFYGCLDTFSCLGTGRHDNCGESIFAGEIPLKATRPFRIRSCFHLSFLSQCFHIIKPKYFLIFSRDIKIVKMGCVFTNFSSKLIPLFFSEN